MEKGRVNNFAAFSPKKKFLRLSVKCPQNERFESQLDEAGLGMISYSKGGRYKIRLYKKDIEKNADFLTEILQAAYGKTAE